MKPVHYHVTVASLVALLGLRAVADALPEQGRLLDHEVRRLDSQERANLQATYAGKVILIVNTASQCALTDQYEETETSCDNRVPPEGRV